MTCISHRASNQKAPSDVTEKSHSEQDSIYLSASVPVHVDHIHRMRSYSQLYLAQFVLFSIFVSVAFSFLCLRQQQSINDLPQFLHYGISYSSDGNTMDGSASVLWAIIYRFNNSLEFILNNKKGGFKPTPKPISSLTKQWRGGIFCPGRRAIVGLCNVMVPTKFN